MLHVDSVEKWLAARFPMAGVFGSAERTTGQGGLSSESLSLASPVATLDGRARSGVIPSLVRTICQRRVIDQAP